MRTRHHLFGLFFLAGMLCILYAGLMPVRAGAADIRPGCDPEFMDALEARSWILGQRRISQNQNLIFKPDSVLEYSCFDQHIGYLAANEARRFSEEIEYWGPISAISPETLDFALFEVVTMPLIEYLNANFFHTFLGGRMEDIGGEAPPYGVYNCLAMQTVWLEARCQQFMEEGTRDGFYDFPWYFANDPRVIPPEFECLPAEAIAPGIIEVYRGQGQDGIHGDEHLLYTLYEENDPALDDGVFYEEDPILVYELLDLMLPDDCALSAVVPTGVFIEIPGDKSFAEHVCSMPGCSFDGELCVLD